MSPRIPMKVRHVRVSDKDWAAAQQAADECDENLSEEIRKFIVRYGKKAGKK